MKEKTFCMISVTLCLMSWLIFVPLLNDGLDSLQIYFDVLGFIAMSLFILSLHGCMYQCQRKGQHITDNGRMNPGIIILLIFQLIFIQYYFYCYYNMIKDY